MSTRFRHRLPAFLQFATVMLAASSSFAGSWGSLNKDYGGGLQMELYTPTTPAASPAIMVALHYCSGHSSNAHGWFDSAADKNGFYIIAPDAGSGNTCFDASLSRDGERADVVKMVQWVVDQKKADKTRVFAAGFSSGGCMTNTLLAIYPDVFAGGSAMPGVAAGGWPKGKSCPCNAPPGMWSTQTNPTDGKFWGDKARAVFQYSGTRPCVQEWVGSSDEYGFAAWLPTVAAQFQDLSGLGSGSAGTGAPSGWSRTEYKDTAGNVRLQTNTKSGQAHNLIGVVPADAVISFLGLDKPTGACGVTTGGGGAGSGGSTSTGGASAGGGSAKGGTNAGGGSAKGGSTSAGGGTTSGGGTATTSGGTSNGAGGSSTGNGGSSNGTGGSSNGNGGAGSGNTNGGSTNASGGATTGSGGSTNSTTGGASTGTGGSTSGGASGGSDSGCSCTTVGAHQQNVAFSSIVGLALCAGVVARRRSQKRVR